MLRWLLPIMIISFTVPILMEDDAYGHSHYGLKLCENDHYKCVRVFPKDAKWLNEKFIKVGSTGVHVKPYK